jgi:hypothetical protein
MRGMHKFIVASALAVSLAGCLHQQQAATCQSYGHQQGTPGFEGCMRAEQELELAKSQQLTNGLLGAAALYSIFAQPTVTRVPAGAWAPSPPPIVRCSQMGIYWTCQ